MFYALECVHFLGLLFERSVIPLNQFLRRAKKNFLRNVLRCHFLLSKQKLKNRHTRIPHTFSLVDIRVWVRNVAKNEATSVDMTEFFFVVYSQRVVFIKENFCEIRVKNRDDHDAMTKEVY